MDGDVDRNVVIAALEAIYDIFALLVVPVIRDQHIGNDSDRQQFHAVASIPLQLAELPEDPPILRKAYRELCGRNHDEVTGLWISGWVVRDLVAVDDMMQLSGALRALFDAMVDVKTRDPDRPTSKMRHSYMEMAMRTALSSAPCSPRLDCDTPGGQPPAPSATGVLDTTHTVGAAHCATNTSLHAGAAVHTHDGAHCATDTLLHAGAAVHTHSGRMQKKRAS